MSENKRYPLSPMQQGMLLHTVTDPIGDMYVVQYIIRLHEKIHLQWFENAWRSLIQRHEVLRAGFSWKDIEEPEQVVTIVSDFSIEQEDWNGISREQAEVRLEQFLKADRRRGFEMGKPPLMRVFLIKLGEGEYICVWTFHHILMDARAADLIADEVFGLYDASVENSQFHLEERNSFYEYLNWVRNIDLGEDELFYKNLLHGITSPTEIPINKGTDNQSIEEGGVLYETMMIGREATERINYFAKGNGISLHSLMQAAWSLLLHYYSGEDDVVYGSILTCRNNNLAGAKGMIGLMINTVPMRVSIKGEEIISELTKRVHFQSQQIKKHNQTPLPKILEWSGMPAGIPLFHTTLVHERFYYYKPKWLKGINREFDYRQRTNQAINVLSFEDQDEHDLKFRMEYDSERFGSDFIKRMLTHMERIIQNIVSHPGEKVSEIEILSEPEIEEIIIKWNQTEKDYPKSKCLHNYFEEQVKRTPNNTALIFKDQELTYQEFNEKANQLANFLKQNGVRPARLVGILMERSLEMLIAIYGALKAGCAYVPLDPEYPNDRLKLLIEDINAAAILTQSHLLAKISDCDSSIISIDKQWGEISKNNSKDPEHYDPSNLAYVIYTSGSTGRPKGVMIEHKSICNRLFWMQEEYCLREGEAVLQKTPFTFDVSVWELFWPLLFGAKLVIAEPQMHRDSAALVKIINEKKISTIHFVPSMLQVFLEDKAVQTCKTLKRVFCSGEALPFELQTRFFSLLQADLHNLYGPTEAAVDVSYWPCEKNSKDRSVPIGKPVANTQLYILNKYLKPVPVGITGELYIGGVQVARGYLNLPEMTKEKFIDLPIGNGKGGRLYKTGDLCLFRRDGNIEYLGRNDFQIKIRGLRVEIGEIEALIKQISGMREVIVLAREDEPGDKRIIAYFINSSEMKVDVKEISKELRDKLPAHMIPSAFVPMDAFPLTSSGKIDRRGFPRPEFDRKKDRTYVEPKGKIEREISEIWRKLLKVEKVGLQDNFFDLGGNSLLLIRALNRLREMYGGNLSIMDMFKHPTVENLGGLVRRERIREEAKIGSRSEEIYLRAKKQRGILNRPRNIDIGRKQNE